LQLKSKRNQSPNRTKKEKPKTSLDTKTEKPPVFFYENRKPDVKKQKIPPTAMNTKTKKIKSFVTKTEKPSQKIAQTTKLKILMPPFFLYNCLGFSD